MPASFLWYDLETWGTDPRASRIAQFGAQRTDDQLQPLADPQLIWVAPALDFLPSPEAALITGLDPAVVADRGLCEADAFKRIAADMQQPETCSVGWNSIRFDDEFIRYGLYRNFHDPYAREWANGNSRWDLLDFARLCHALRPDGIDWPRREDGAPSFRLEHLAAANGVEHGQAHDALSDVQATLGLARRMRAAQPRLWNYYLGLRDKRRGAELLRLPAERPLLHISQRFPATRACAGIIWPLCRHPRASNQIIALELHDAPDALIALSVEALRERVFVARDQLAEGTTRIALKAIHLNRCPVLVELQHVRADEWARMGVDLDRCLQHAEQLGAAAELAEKVEAVFAQQRYAAAEDVDAALYDALPERADEPQRRRVRAASPDQLAALGAGFRDPRANELLWRYRGRNWPASLSPAEHEEWRQDVLTRLRSATNSETPFDDRRRHLAALQQQHQGDARAESLLRAVGDWYGVVERACAADGDNAPPP